MLEELDMLRLAIIKKGSLYPSKFLFSQQNIRRDFQLQPLMTVFVFVRAPKVCIHCCSSTLF